ncbi:MAG: DUF3824 domain-containing protein, partial [Lewinella sp.]|nr:DUF3824 domain-containing protein [Lewinella sp.]
NYGGGPLVTQADDASFAKWGYTLDRLKFDISSNETEGVLIEGTTHVPIFDKISPGVVGDVSFSDGWVPFVGTISYDQKIILQMQVTQIADKIFHSSFIPGLGMRINMGSCIEFLFDVAKGEFESKARLNGIALVVINEQSLQSMGLPSGSIPSGLEFSFPFLGFQDMTINHEEESCGTPFRGIQSFSLGTWGILPPFDPRKYQQLAGYFGPGSQNNGANSATMANGATNKGQVFQNAAQGQGSRRMLPSFLQRFSITVHTPTFHCEGDTEYKFNLGLSIKLKGDDNGGSATSNATNPTNNPDPSQYSGGYPPAPGQSGYGNPSPYGNPPPYGIQPPSAGDVLLVDDNPSAAWAAYFPPHIPPPLGIPSGGYSTSTSPYMGNNPPPPIGIPTGTPPPPPTGQARTSNFTASGQLQFVFGTTGSGDNAELEFKRIDPGCFELIGEYGPVKVSGGINFLKSADGGALYGSGFKGYLTALIAGIETKIVGQYGVIGDLDNKPDEAYRYFFMDLQVASSTGLPLGPYAELYGGAGGFRYNMAITENTLPGYIDASGTAASQQAGNALTRYTEPPDNNDFCAIPSEYLAAGKSLSGATYRPEKGTFGGNLQAILGTKKPNTAVIGDLGLDIQIQVIDNRLSWNRITFRGNGYFAYNPVPWSYPPADRIADVKAEISYDFSQQVLAGYFGYRVDFKLPTGQPLLEAPIGGEGYNEGRLRFDFSRSEWEIKFGSWGEPTDGQRRVNLSPPSGLDYLSHKIYFPAFSLINSSAGITLKGYFQAGMNVDPIPPLSYQIPNWQGPEPANNNRRLNTSQYRTGNGLVFGAKVELDAKVDFYPFSARLLAGVGFDVSLQKYDPVPCDPAEPPRPIGIDGWYAKGQTYAYLNGSILMDYDLWFTSGRIKIVEVNAYAALRVELPNPSYFDGYIFASYSVLDGLLSGSVNFHLELGDKCQGATAPSPVAGIKIFSEATPEGDDASIFTDVQVVTNVALNKDLVFPVYDDDYNLLRYDRYRVLVHDCKVTRQGSNEALPAEWLWEENGYGITLDMQEILDERTNYTIHYHFRFQQDSGNGFRDVMEDGEYIEEVGTVDFRTGDFPDHIVKEMLEVQAPGYRQRFWTAGYAEPLLRFDPAISNRAADAFFMPTTEIDGQAYPNDFVGELFVYKPDGSGEIEDRHLIPITAYPNIERFEKIVIEEKTIQGIYRLPFVTTKEVAYQEVRFPALNSIDLDGGRICFFRLIRRPSIEAIATESTVETTQVGESTINVRRRRGNRQLLQSLAEHTKILYEYHFATASAPLHERLKNIAPDFQRSLVSRNDFNHPDEATDVQIGQNENHAAKDEYFSFRAIYTQGFDQFDLDRIRRNARVTYLDQYGAEYTINQRYGSNVLHPHVAGYLNSVSDWRLRNYLRSVLKKYTSIGSG